MENGDPLDLALVDFMPPPSFFCNLGLFVRHKFFDEATCAQILREMQEAEAQKALVFRGEAEGDVLDESRRKVLVSVGMEKRVKAMVSDRLIALKPLLEEHFRTSLTDMEPPAFLRYRQGAFYKLHRDAHPDDPSEDLKRRVAVVSFLNSASKEPAPDSYGGGSLTFYGLLDGLQWEKCGFQLEAEPGVLVAFRADTLHEVQPVTFGERFTIVTWFLS